MKMKKTVLGALAALTLLTGCGGVQAGGDEVPVQFGGGVAEDSKVKGCKPQGTREAMGDLGDSYLKVPAGVRNYRAKGDGTGVEQGAMTFTVKGVELQSNVQVGYAVNTDCKRPGGDDSKDLAVLETFARDFGLKYERSDGDGWFRALLIDYVGTPTDQALDDAAAELVKKNPKLTWRNFRGDATIKQQFEEATGRHAQALIEKEMGAAYLCGPGSDDKTCKPLVITVSPPKPTDGAYTDLIRDEEVAAGQVQIAAQQKLANNARLDADAKVREAYGSAGAIEQRRLDLIEKAIDGGKVTILPLPAGAGVAVNPTP